LKKGSKYVNYVKITCKCGNEFYVTQKRLEKWGPKYCSRTCYFKHGKILKCLSVSELIIPEGVLVKEYHGFFIFSNGIVINKFGKKISTHINNKGYETVRIYFEGKYRTTTIHILVAENFILNPENKPEVNHKDGIKLNNNYTNLEWVTHLENMQHAYLNKLVPPVKCKPIIQIDNDGNEIAEYESMSQAACKFNKNPGDFGRGIKKGYKVVGFHWKLKIA
jgi:hypothetical protein